MPDPVFAPDALDRLDAAGLTQVADAGCGNRRPVSPEDWRIAGAALRLLGSIQAVANTSDSLATFILEHLASDANELAQELVAAGFRVDRRAGA